MRIKNILLIPVIVFCSACSNFLNEEPLSELASDQFFKEPGQAWSAVNSLYRTGAPNMSDGGVYSGMPVMLGAYMSGFFSNEYAGQELHVSNTQQLTHNGDNIGGYLQDRWRELYLGVSRANNAIKYIPDTPELTSDEKNQLIGEAKFFRAYAYYYLVRLFGPIPLTTEPYASLENLYLERSSVADVYALIEADLKDALQNGGLATVNMVDNGKRITAGAVATLLAEVYLTMSGAPLNADRYSDAASVAQDIINGTYGDYSLVGHSETASGVLDFENSAYNKIRKSDASPQEHIYIKEFDASISRSEFAKYSYPTALSQDVLYDITNGAYQPSNAFLNLYDPLNDLRAQEKQFFHTTLEGTDKTFPPTPYVWHDDEAIFNTANSGKDQAMFSYPDVLLIAAEAIAKSTGVNTNAIDYLSQVRARAYWKTDINDIKLSVSTLSTQQFVEEVWLERHRELVFEFQNWFDIVRTRKFPVANAPGEVSFVEVIGHITSQGKQIEEKHLLLPLPGPEMQRNPSLGTDNNGY
ncbi:RagB/SusD family nutrient uptake outer membrane protein [Arenibacter sp. 6A1]|uniref:RagB/SusD family nutrient uptake outer membrane protein n=1 Tax=Arenibacter sp. 6A1 TaxID=2720391 RepID=UPI0014460966|nr:RagB/SusD family nutrient uptake outer membrane protein [Arenibacter sp. 6A1]NKI27065.1 RagB/SusD family nutrient uptake outer membrane protein [Arenibacter sp. 6A1]